MGIQLIDITLKISGQKIEDTILMQLANFKINFSNGTAAVAKINFIDYNFKIQKNNSFSIGKELSIEVKERNKTITIFKGDILRVDYIFEAKNSDKVQLICYDRLYKLARIFNSKVYLKSKISDIASKMAREAGLSSKVDSTGVKHEHIYQSNQSNLDFLMMHAKRLGYEINVLEGKLHFVKAGYQTKTKSSIVLKWGENLNSFTAKTDVSDVLVDVSVNSWDSNKKETVESNVKAGSEKKIGNIKNKGTQVAKNSLKNCAKIYKLDLGNLDTKQAKEIATAHLTNASMNYLIAEGSCKDEPRFQIGKFLDIDGVGDKVSGDYYITAYEHIFNNNGFKTFFEVRANGTFK